MNIRIAFRNMDHSASIEAYAQKELEKIFKFLKNEGDLIHIDLVLDAARIHHHHKVELRLNSKHYHLVASHEGADLYQEIDYVIKTMAQEIKKHKEKSLDKRNHPNIKKDLYEQGDLSEDEIAEQAFFIKIINPPNILLFWGIFFVKHKIKAWIGM